MANPIVAPVRGDDALQEYLDLLLKPAVADPKPFAEPSPRALRMPLPPLAPPLEERRAQVAAAVPLPAVVAVPVVEAPVPVAPEVSAPPVVTPAVVETALPPAAHLSAALPASPPESTPVSVDLLEPAPWAANGRPQWAQQRFEALLFTVGGLNLAVPLAELGAIHALEGRELTPIFGQVEWFLGMLPLKEGALRVVDTARVVMPERYDDAMPQGYRYVITLSGSDWGLGVDVIHDSVQLEPEAVRWRSARGKRPWLAGTVVEQMCALLDAAQLTWMFHTLDRHRGGGLTSGRA